MNYEHIITIEPDKRSGKPCIRGLRIAIQDVLGYLASGMTEDEILADFPELTHEDIKACLSFDADRKAADWDSRTKAFKAVGKKLPKKETDAFWSSLRD